MILKSTVFKQQLVGLLMVLFLVVGAGYIHIQLLVVVLSVVNCVDVPCNMFDFLKISLASIGLLVIAPVSIQVMSFGIFMPKYLIEERIEEWKKRRELMRETKGKENPITCIENVLKKLPKDFRWVYVPSISVDELDMYQIQRSITVEKTTPIRGLKRKVKRWDNIGHIKVLCGILPHGNVFLSDLSCTDVFKKIQEEENINIVLQNN